MQRRVGVIVAAAVCLFGAVIAEQVHSQAVRGADTAIKATSKVADGLNITTFETPAGKIAVNSPDDMAASDTLTGTVIADPAGNTRDEIAKNTDELNGYVVEIQNATPPTEVPTPPEEPQPTEPKPAKPKKHKKGTTPTCQPGGYVTFTCPDPGPPMILTLVPKPPKYHPPSCGGCGPALQPPPCVGGCTNSGTDEPPPAVHGPTLCSYPVPLPKTPPPCGGCAPAPGSCTLPQVGQAGRPTKVRSIGCTGYPGQQTLKIGGKRCDPLALSPRGGVFQSPRSPIATDIEYGKDGKVAKGKYHNLSVKLSCPKPVMKKGDSTTLTVTVSGLAGLTGPVTLTIDNHSPNTVNLEGGDHQTITINPTGGDVLQRVIRP